MINTTIALVGLSGVGKSTLIQKVCHEIQFQTLSASQLIKDQKEAYIKHDDLRFHDISDNQRLLIDGFKRAIDHKQKLVLLDAHTVIETANGLTDISAKVFKDIGINQFVFLAEEARTIYHRRSEDDERKRATVTMETLDAYQMHAIEVTTRIALELKIPVTLITSGNITAFKSVLNNCQHPDKNKQIQNNTT